jgi:hypothetical protein
MKRYSFRRTENDGSIAVTVLVIMVILSIACISTARIVMTQMGVASRIVRWNVCPYQAMSAFKAGLADRAQDATKAYDSEAELKRERGARWEDGSGYTYVFEDEGSKININTAPKSVLEGLPGMTEDAAEGIVKCNRRPFAQKEEILLAEEMTREIFEKARNFITVYGTSRININTAKPEVLAALGFDEELIDILMRFRKEYPGKDDKAGTADDGAFTSTDGMIAELSKFASMSTNQEMQIMTVKNMLTVKSSALCQKVTALVNGKPANTYSLITSGSSGKILRWQE